MAYTPINSAAYAAAYSGAIAAFAVLGYITDNNQNDYNDFIAGAKAFAQAFDQAWNSQFPMTVIEQNSATQIVQALLSKRSTPTISKSAFANSSTWTAAAKACVSLILQGDVVFSGKGPGGSSAGVNNLVYVPGSWITALDFDFTTLPTQVIAADGNVSLGGLTWNKANSANEVVHATITNGVGLTFQPTSATDYFQNTRTLPLLSLTLTQIIPNVYFNMPVRLWAYVSATNAAAQFDSAVLGFEGNGTILQGYAFKKGWNNDNLNGYLTAYNFRGVNEQSSDEQTSPTDNVMVMIVPGYPQDSLITSSGVYSSGWPSVSSLNSHGATSSSLAGVGTTPQGTPQNMDVFVGANRAGSATALSITFSRLRVDYRP